jgi:hypothetical protein
MEHHFILETLPFHTQQLPISYQSPSSFQSPITPISLAQQHSFSIHSKVRPAAFIRDLPDLIPCTTFCSPPILDRVESDNFPQCNTRHGRESECPNKYTATSIKLNYSNIYDLKLLFRNMYR